MSMTLTDSSGAIEHNDELVAMLNEEMIVAAHLLGERLQQYVIPRTPTVDREYEILMVGWGGDTPLQVPRSGDTSDDSAGDDPSIIRTRLKKPVETYLRNITASPMNMAVMVDISNAAYDDITVGVGNVPLLEGTTKFEYVNSDGEEYVVGGEGGLFQAFEVGSVGEYATVVPSPLRGRTKNGKFYPLRPGYQKKGKSDPEAAKKQMYKPIPPFNMYDTAKDGADLDFETHLFMAEYLESLGPGTTSY